jgi:MFS family permease
MALGFVVLLAFLTHLGFAGSRLPVTLFAIEQGATPFVVGTIVALYAALLALPAGRMADRLGFKLPLLFGTGGVFVALLLPAVWPTMAMLYVSASLLGLAFMGLQLATQTLAGVLAVPSERARNYSFLSLGFALGSFGGPLLSGVLIDSIGYTYTFCALAIPIVPAIVIAVLGSRWLPTVQKRTRAARAGMFDLLKIKPLRSTFVMAAIISGTWDLYQFVMPVYAHSRGLSATALGALLSAFAGGIIFVRILLPFVVRRTGEARMLTYAMFVGCAAFCLFAAVQGAWILAVASFLLGLACGCGQPLTMTILYNASPTGRVAEATGMRITINQSVMFAIPLLFGALGSVTGFTTVFLTGAACLLAGGRFNLGNHSKR